jgi:hypothetical protein
MEGSRWEGQKFQNNEIVAPDVEEGIKSLPPSQIFSGSSTAYNLWILTYSSILLFYALMHNNPTYYSSTESCSLRTWIAVCTYSNVAFTRLLQYIHSVYNLSPQSLEYSSQSAIRTPTHTLGYNNSYTKWKLQKKQWNDT